MRHMMFSTRVERREVRSIGEDVGVDEEEEEEEEEEEMYKWWMRWPISSVMTGEWRS